MMITYKEKELIKEYLSGHDTFRLIDICNYLISNGSSTAIYSTGKYKIYPLVGAFIKNIITGTELEIKQIENDVEYTKVGNLSFESESKVDMQIKENKQKNSGQLSLF